MNNWCTCQNFDYFYQRTLVHFKIKIGVFTFSICHQIRNPVLSIYLDSITSLTSMWHFQRIFGYFTCKTTIILKIQRNQNKSCQKHGKSLRGKKFSLKSLDIFVKKPNKITNFEVWRQKLVKSPLIRQFYFKIWNLWCGIWSKRAHFGLVILTVFVLSNLGIEVFEELTFGIEFWRLDFWNWNLNKPLSRLFFKRKNIFSSSSSSKNFLVSGQNKKIEKLI